MQQTQNQNINQSHTGKREPPKVNGQAIKANQCDGSVPAIPAKPAKHTLSFKPMNESHPAPVADQTSNNKAPVANTTEADEIEFLLDEIRDLEVPACRTDSEQDFEIAGSRADLDLSLHLDSPIDTSWYYFSISFALNTIAVTAFSTSMKRWQ